MFPAGVNAPRAALVFKRPWSCKGSRGKGQSPLFSALGYLDQRRTRARVPPPGARRVGAAVGASFQDYAPAAKRAQVRPQPCPWQIVTPVVTPDGKNSRFYWAKCAKTHDARAREVGLRHSSCEAGEQSGAIRCGASGAKGGDQRECGSAKHAPDSEPHKRVTGAGSHTANRCRRYPRWEPYPGKPHVRICAGGAR